MSTDIEQHPTIIAFRKEAGHASYHFADDSAREWGEAYAHQHECQRLYDEADETLREHMRAIRGSFLISLKTECRP